MKLQIERDPARLREQAADALERGLAFVDRDGDALSRLRVRVVLEAEPAASVVAALAPRQTDDGSFPPLGLSEAGALGFEAPDAVGPDDVLGTLEALGVLSDVGSLHAGCVERAARFLEQTQLGDGSWGDAASDPARRVFATGMLGGLLARTRYARPHALEASGAFLDAHWSPKDVVEGGFGLLASSSVFFGNAEGERSEAVSAWCGRELERRFRQGELGALPVLRILMYRNVMAIPGTGLEPLELLAGLLDAQHESGAFPGFVRPDVAPTLDAIRAIPVLCSAL